VGDRRERKRRKSEAERQLALLARQQIRVALHRQQMSEAEAAGQTKELIRHNVRLDLVSHSVQSQCIVTVYSHNVQSQMRVALYWQQMSEAEAAGQTKELIRHNVRLDLLSLD
jgi:DNA gyrase/topoisomerase IV subunit B